MRKPRKGSAPLESAAARTRIARAEADAKAQALDRTFSALGDPWRRAILAHLAADGRLAISDIAKPLPMSLPAVLKHIAVLIEAGLIGREKIGRTVYCWLVAGPMREAGQWLEAYRRHWEAATAAGPTVTPEVPKRGQQAAKRPRKSVAPLRRKAKIAAPARKAQAKKPATRKPAPRRPSSRR